MSESINTRDVVMRMRQQGQSVRAISAALGVTKYQIERILHTLSGQTPKILDESPVPPETPDTSPVTKHPPKLYLTAYKRLPRLIAAQPHRPVLMITNLDSPPHQSIVDALESIAAALNVQLSIRVGASAAEIATAVKALTQEGDLICDPILGTGSVADAAFALGRRFVGCDVSERNVYAVMRRYKISH